MISHRLRLYGWIIYICIVRSYLAESTGSHPNSEVKQLWACTVLRWGTTRESQVTHVLAFHGSIPTRFYQSFAGPFTTTVEPYLDQ